MCVRPALHTPLEAPIKIAVKPARALISEQASLRVVVAIDVERCDEDHASRSMIGARKSSASVLCTPWTERRTVGGVICRLCDGESAPARWTAEQRQPAERAAQAVLREQEKREEC